MIGRMFFFFFEERERERKVVYFLKINKILSHRSYYTQMLNIEL